MKQPTILATLVATSTLLALGCNEELRLDSSTDEIFRCAGCGKNGLDLPSSTAARLALGPTSLASSGLMSGGLVEPLCDVSTASAHSCDIHPLWDTWRHNGPHRDGIFEYVVKAALDDSFALFAGSEVFVGQFALAPNAATAALGPREQERVTAGLALLTNVSVGVDICLAYPGRTCPAPFNFQELQATGNLFDGSGRIVIGSPFATDPQANHRTCLGGAGACPTLESDFGYLVSPSPCHYIGPMSARIADTCLNGTWTNPVSAFTIVDPGSYYAGARGPIVIR